MLWRMKESLESGEEERGRGLSGRRWFLRLCRFFAHEARVTIIDKGGRGLRRATGTVTELAWIFFTLVVLLRK